MADILIVDDQDRYLELCRAAIPEHRYHGPARNLAGAREALKRLRGRVDLVLLDVHFDIPEADLVGLSKGASPREVERVRRHQGVLILESLRQSWPDLPVIVMTSREELALESELAGDEDFTYFLEDDYVDARALQSQIHNLVALRDPETSTGPIYWGESLRMGRLRARLDILARGRLPVVLLGPMGTGKSLLARHFVHARSGRPGKFVAVDLSTVPAELMAAHLFGAVKGAYTGSVADRKGAFEEAHHGTLFLDEVGNLSLAAQKMLLSVLQEGCIVRVGDVRERAVDVKLVVATNEDLRARVRDGSFRGDLFMRLNPAAAVELPSLAERNLDVADLLGFSLRGAFARPYLKGLVAEYREATGLAEGPVEFVLGHAPPAARPGVLLVHFPERAVRQMRKHTWPGNLREFAMTAENAVLFALAELTTSAPGGRSDVVSVRPKLVRDLLAANQPPDTVDEPGGLNDVRITLQSADTLNKVSVGCERQYFTALYLRTRGDFGAMAEALLGDAAHARKVQLRFNQLGLKVRELKERLS